MGYEIKCLSCYGAKTWDGKPCRKCAGSGVVKPYRRKINLTEGNNLGWYEMPVFPRLAADGNCVVCNTKLQGRKRTFCSKSCHMGYLWRVWKGAHWQKRAVYARDGAACKACGEVFEKPIRDGGPMYPDFSQLQLDHIQPLHLGGTEKPENCQLLCDDCHTRKSVSERRFARQSAK